MSKIVWLGIIQTLIGALLEISDYLSTGKPFDALGIILIVIGILTVILRVWFTDTPIGSSKSSEPPK
jgi:hypothetical protein